MTDKLNKYCFKKSIINEKETYIISTEHYDDILNDTELLEQLNIRASLKGSIEQMMENASQTAEIKVQFAFVYHEKRKLWEPVNVAEYENNYYHVFISLNWLCRECRHSNEGTIIMPMHEAAPGFMDSYRLKPHIPDIFRKRPCEKCGKMLQNHLLIIK